MNVGKCHYLINVDSPRCFACVCEIEKTAVHRKHFSEEREGNKQGKTKKKVRKKNERTKKKWSPKQRKTK